MVSVKETQALYNYVEGRLKSGEVKGAAFKELFEVRNRLTDILSEHYVKRNNKKYNTSKA